MNPTEHQIQSAFFKWWDMNYRSPLAWAVPNGGFRHITTAIKLKLEGVRPGIPDVFISIPKGKWSGLFLEFKTKTGTLTKPQKFYLDALSKAGYQTAVVRSVDEAISVVHEYMKQSNEIQKQV